MTDAEARGRALRALARWVETDEPCAVIAGDDLGALFDGLTAAENEVRVLHLRERAILDVIQHSGYPELYERARAAARAQDERRLAERRKVHWFEEVV